MTELSRSAHGATRAHGVTTADSAADSAEAEPSLGRHLATRRGRRLEIFTLAWNGIEAVVSVAAGWWAGSSSLVGFGLDSMIESISGAALLWRLQDGDDGDDGERREEIALRLVGTSFLLLAAWVAWESAEALWLAEAPRASWVGIALAALSLVVMPILARAKRRVATDLGSRALQADSRQTDICAWLSAILLAGLGLNALLGWWWADPAAGLLMVPLITKEGVDALRGDPCECI